MSDLEKIANLARDSAQENGRVLPILDDIKAAFADVLPSSQLLPTVSASHPEMFRSVATFKAALHGSCSDHASTPHQSCRERHGI